MGALVGLMTGILVGFAEDGLIDGAHVGVIVGFTDGLRVGTLVGADGTKVGVIVGFLVGDRVGLREDGFAVTGLDVGVYDTGFIVGDFVTGWTDGDGDGFTVGLLLDGADVGLLGLIVGVRVGAWEVRPFSVTALFSIVSSNRLRSRLREVADEELDTDCTLELNV